MHDIPLVHDHAQRSGSLATPSYAAARLASPFAPQAAADGRKSAYRCWPNGTPARRWEASMNQRIPRHMFRLLAVTSTVSFAIGATARTLDSEAPRGTFSVDSIFGTGFEDHTALQWIRRNADRLSGLTVALAPTLVTFVGGQLQYMQVPPDVGGAGYPRYSALRVFGQPSGTPVAAGDCVILSGTVGVFQGGAQLVPASMLVAAPADCGNAAIPPPLAVASVDSIATDSDAGTAGDQPGDDAAALQGVLITLTAMRATTTVSNGLFQVEAQSNPGPFVLVGSTFYAYTPSLGEDFSTVTGVLEIRGSPSRVVLLPRSASDLVP
jgi:hypothetical protein